MPRKQTAGTKKRGRPPLPPSTDPSINKKRAQGAERARNFARRRAAARTAAQDIQIREVAERSTIAEDAAEPTMLALGLRLEGLNLPVDPEQAEEAEEAIDVEPDFVDHGDEFTWPDSPEVPETVTIPTRRRPPVASSVSEEEDLAMDVDESASVTRAADTGDVARRGALAGRAGLDDDDRDDAQIFPEPAVSDSDGEDGEGAVDPAIDAAQELVTSKLAQQLRAAHGCSPEEHDAWVETNCTQRETIPLSAVSVEPDFPSVLNSPTFMSSSERRSAQPLPGEWAKMFSGTLDGGQAPRVCLHCETTAPSPTSVAYDIDSFLGFASSLAVARGGINCDFAPMALQNIQTDVHIEMQAIRDSPNGDGERTASVMLKDVPHFQLGRMTGAENITVHILFPRMPTRGKFVAMTQDQLARWTDRILMPAIHEHVPSHVLQHIPPNYPTAQHNSRAHQLETRGADTVTRGTSRSIGYHFGADVLEQIWQSIQLKVEEPGLRDFLEPQIFFNAKGVKLQFKTTPERPTLANAIDHFRSYIESKLNAEFVIHNRFWVDVGKEVCVDVRSHDPGAPRNEAHTFLWRRCCLERYLTWLYDGQPPKSGPGQTWYLSNMLHDGCCLTSLTPRKSPLRLGGLIYSQFYASVKEVTDATNKCFPFANDNLELLTLNPNMLKGLQNIIRGRAATPEVIQEAYIASKKRSNLALTGSIGKAFGAREEHRISWRALARLREALHGEEVDTPIAPLARTPSYVWAVRTDVYLMFLWRCLDKYATGFEWIRTGSLTRQGPSWEDTKVMAMFLRCLRYVLGGQILAGESALWWSEREAQNPRPGRPSRYYGLGFRHTSQRFGYCWIEPRVDWERLHFFRRYTGGVLFGNQIIARRCLQHGKAAGEYLELQPIVEETMTWLGDPQCARHVQGALVERLCYLVCRQMRKDVLVTIEKELRPDSRADASDALHPWDYDYLRDITARELSLVNGNKTQFKTPFQLVDFLFGDDDKSPRKHWKHRPFRTMHQLILSTLEGSPETHAALARYQSKLPHFLVHYHYILPYPSDVGLCQTTKGGHRMWYSIIRDAQGQYVWGREKRTKDRAPAFKAEMSGWDTEQWRRHLARHGFQLD